MRLLATVALSALAAQANALEIWLASGEECTSCLIYQRAAQARGYGNALRHAGQTLPILSINKNVLAADILEQLPPEQGPESPFWPQTLTVLVMDVGRVVFAGTIAESADNNELRYSEAVMFPPAEPAADDPAVRVSSPYADFFAAQWNLEYFVDVALGRQPRRATAGPIDLASPAPAALGQQNVILWGSAETPLANALFIPTRIAEIRATLERAGFADVRYLTLHGHGPGVAGNDTSYVADGRVSFRRADLDADLAADAAGLNSALTAVLQQSRARTLLVQVGHSGPAGSPLWGHGLTLAPATLERIGQESTGSLIMVSGACHSGQFAKAVQCGFFAAHPDVTAAGCQLSPEALEASDDYLRHFFAGVTAGAGAGTGRRNREPPTLYDAHWHASSRLEDHQLSYTTTDALIDEFFAANPDKLPASMTVAEVRAAAPALTRGEAEAAIALTAGLAADAAIALTGYVEANYAAEQKLTEATELPSAARNRITALPYKLVLPLLARRIAYAAAQVADADYARAANCERQSLQQFLGSGR